MQNCDETLNDIIHYAPCIYHCWKLIVAISNPLLRNNEMKLIVARTIAYNVSK